MKVILVMVQTLNGKITRGNDPHIKKWTSKEDADFFFSMIKKHDLIVMGSGTYEAAKSTMKPVPGKLRLILTRTPEKYKREEIPGQIEFSNLSPKKVVAAMKERGYKVLLFVGGGEMNKAFFEENAVDELYLTIEPRLFGQGKQVVADGSYDSVLRLNSVKKLNKQGALLLHYLIEH